jgi:hypothetical protein
LQALHLVGIRQKSSITTTFPISSAIHITDCHDSSIRTVQVQQLRLHESTNLLCHVDLVTAGAMLEDCKDIVFVVPSADQDKCVVDVRDFNWLREGIPSPNFRIEGEVAAQSIEKIKETGVEATSSNLPGVGAGKSTRADTPTDNNITTEPNDEAGTVTSHSNLRTDPGQMNHRTIPASSEQDEDHDEDEL